MSKLGAKSYDVFDEDNPEHREVHLHPASTDAVRTVLEADVESDDGRSEWLWVRLPNGDLVLGVFPMGDTYFATELDHSV